jgi:hypothetical protein
MGGPEDPEDHSRAGILEYSPDGVLRIALATGAGAEVRATTDNDGLRCVVREFQVCVPGQIGHTVTPAGRPAISPPWPTGRWTPPTTASTAPAEGDALVVTAPAARPLRRVRVPGSAGSATVEARTSGTWRHIGDVRAAYADLETGGAMVDAVRLTWSFGSPTPVDRSDRAR